MLVNLTTAFLGLSLLFYCLFAGADFGAGILEWFLDRKDREAQKRVITRAIGPVWEANHVWLILAVVILFTAFPKAYSALSVTYYIPLTFLLVGIILRGCSFTFRHYDAVRDGSQRYYSLIFKLSGVMVPFTLGVIAGGLFLGRGGNDGFASSYLDPWLNLFCFSLGIFTCVLFAFLASVYLVDEAPDAKLRRIFSIRARAFNLAAVGSGLGVFACAQWDGLPLWDRFLSQPWSLACVALATLILLPLWLALRTKRAFGTRVMAALQVALVLLGWFSLQYPVLLTLPGMGKLTLAGAAAPDTTLKYLLAALIPGCLLIFPSLFYLFRVFKGGSFK
jgi:cytochrome d ubiquinol oxidase subunit II